MQLNGKLVVVPLWIMDSVKQLGLPMATLLDMNLLEEHFSSDDIISYHAVNKLFDQLTFRDSIPEVEDSLLCYKDLLSHVDLVKSALSALDSSNANATSKQSFFTDIQKETLVFLKEADGMKTFFNTMTAPSYQPVQVNPNIYVINLFHIEDQNFGLTIKPYDGIATDSELATLNDNMNLLLTHYKYEEVCQTQIFHRWCFTIKRNQQ